MGKKIAGIILAAGLSKRFHSKEPKLLINLLSKPILAHVIENALPSELNKVYIVVGYEKDKIISRIKRWLKEEISVLFNPSFEEGLSSSVKLGVRHAWEDGFTDFMFLMGDMPFVSTYLINLLIHQYKDSDCSICFPLINGKKGHPTIFGERYIEELTSICGDQGGIEIIRRDWDQSLKVIIDDELSQMDIDTIEEYHLLVKWGIKNEENSIDT